LKAFSKVIEMRWMINIINIISMIVFICGHGVVGNMGGTGEETDEDGGIPEESLPFILPVAIGWFR